MRIHNLILGYIAVLMILSQTLWAKFVVFLAIPLLIVLIFRHTRISSFGLKKILFLNLIVLLGFISGIIHLIEHDMYFFFRDIIYFIQAPIFIIIGIYLYKDIKDLDKLLKAIVLTSFIVTIYQLSMILPDFSIIFELGLGIRKEYNVVNYTGLLVFSILYYARKYKYKVFSNYFELFIMAISLLSIIVSLSRTMYFILIIIIIIPYINRKKMIFKIYGFLILLVLFVNFGGLFMNIETTGKQGDNFISKITNSANEIVVKEYSTLSEINNNWRGYEAYLGLSKYYSGDFGELLFGQGYGTVVITPLWIFHGDKLDVLPMFHNGYITIILKTGLLGLVFFFMFLFMILQTGTRIVMVAVDNQQKLIGILLQVSVFIIFARTFVIHGIFTTTVPVLLLLLIGYLLQINVYQDKCSKRNTNKRNNSKC